MRRSFVFTALAVSALAAAPALAQTGTEPAVPGTTPSVEAPAANAPAEPAQQMQHQRHHKQVQTSNADDQAQPRHRRGSRNAAEEEQTRQLNQQQLSGATPLPSQQMPSGQAMPDQMAPMQPGAMDQMQPDQPMPSDGTTPPAGE